MNRPLDQLAAIARDSVHIGNKLIANGRPRAIMKKSERDTYTDVDVRVEREIRAYLASVTPEIGFYGEEEGGVDELCTSKAVWVLDPIDGTSNFVHGVPLSAVQVALVVYGEAIVAAINIPHTNTVTWAAKGMGAHSGSTQIHVSSAAELSHSMIAIGDYAVGDHAAVKNVQRVALTAALAEKVERVRMFGSAAIDMTWLAEGRIDACVIMSNSIVDVAPGILIAREAGATVVDGDGSLYRASSTSVIASSPDISDALVTLVSSLPAQPNTGHQ